MRNLLVASAAFLLISAISFCAVTDRAKDDLWAEMTVPGDAALESEAAVDARAFIRLPATTARIADRPAEYIPPVFGAGSERTSHVAIGLTPPDPPLHYATPTLPSSVRRAYLHVYRL